MILRCFLSRASVYFLQAIISQSLRKELQCAWHYHKNLPNICKLVVLCSLAHSDLHLNSYWLITGVFRRGTRHHPMLSNWWVSVTDSGPALTQHCVNVSVSAGLPCLCSPSVTMAQPQASIGSVQRLVFAGNSSHECPFSKHHNFAFYIYPCRIDYLIILCTNIKPITVSCLLCRGVVGHRP